MAEVLRRLPEVRIAKSCFSVAGIIKDNVCRMTNAPLTIDGGELSRTLKFPVKIINDFTALSYALPLLDADNPDEITQLSAARPAGAVRAVIGAGTGLGVGCLVETDGGFVALASEGGHTDFAGIDAETRELCAWVAGRIGSIPETELFVSGQGLVNIFNFLYEKAQTAGNVSAAFGQIAAADDKEKPSLISQAAGGDSGCADIMRLFVKMYARAAANTAVTFLPTAGLYLAGGITGKNERFFLDGGAFMKTFLVACKPSIGALLQSIPVYIIKDYSVSLTGAANAARYFIKDA
jgi:glucokinase